MSAKRNVDQVSEDFVYCSKKLCRQAKQNGTKQFISRQMNLDIYLRISDGPRSAVTKSCVTASGKCFNCGQNFNSVDKMTCSFCERPVCGDCHLYCSRCELFFCRLCAVKSYDSQLLDNNALCLSCGQRKT